MTVHHETEYRKAEEKRKLWYVETHLVEHCNLNCKHCDHFSCVAEPSFLEVGAFERDLRRIKELSSGMERLRLLGGEPLLHPRITEFFAIAREIFPGAVIDVITNGILLPKMPAEFFEAMKTHQVAVATSPYYKEGHKIYQEINAAYERHQVPESLRLYMGSYYEKKFSFIALDRKGSQDKEHSFKNCWHAAFRVFLREGKIFPCPVAANIHHFNGHFGEKENFQLTENDCIDIYKVKSEEEVVAFLSKPIDFCRFCDMSRRTMPLYTLTVTKKEQSEWVYN